MNLFIVVFIYSFIYLFICLFIFSCIYLFTYFEVKVFWWYWDLNINENHVFRDSNEFIIKA